MLDLNDIATVQTPVDTPKKDFDNEIGGHGLSIERHCVDNVAHAM